MATGPLSIVPGVPHTARRPIRCAVVEGETSLYKIINVEWKVAVVSFHGIEKAKKWWNATWPTPVHFRNVPHPAWKLYRWDDELMMTSRRVVSQSCWSGRWKDDSLVTHRCPWSGWLICLCLHSHLRAEVGRQLSDSQFRLQNVSNHDPVWYEGSGGRKLWCSPLRRMWMWMIYFWDCCCCLRCSCSRSYSNEWPLGRL